MKAHLPSLLVLALSLFSLGAQETGRYLITTGQYASIARTEHITIKIDTTTGDTWQLTEYPVEQKGNKYRVIGWAPLYDDVVTVAAEINKANKPLLDTIARSSGEARRENAAHISHMVTWAEQHLLTGGTYVSLDGSTNKFTAESAAQILRTYKP